jgi:spermidine synthase
MLTAKAHEKVLIIGGGDGMALREVLKYDDVGSVTLVDLDPTITTLFQNNETLSRLNKHALKNKKVTIINQDAWKFIENTQALYDVIIIDLPDPNNLSISKLYSQTFYRLISSQLSKAGAMVTQATSPMFSRKSFWCIDQTIADAKLQTVPYHTYIPSFGEWGFVLATHQRMQPRPADSSFELRYFNDALFKQMQHFAPDIGKVDVEGNRISTHKLIYYYDKGWSKWYEN